METAKRISDELRSKRSTQEYLQSLLAKPFFPQKEKDHLPEAIKEIMREIAELELLLKRDGDQDIS